MKLLLFFIISVCLLGVVAVAEFSDEGDFLFPIKTHVNDRLHVYRTAESEHTTGIVDESDDVDAATQAERNEAFPEEMPLFIDRLRSQTVAMRNELDNGMHVDGFDQADVLLALYEVDVALDEALVLLDTEQFAEAELSVADAVDAYVRAKEALESGR
jgi:hypothetical protein